MRRSSFILCPVNNPTGLLHRSVSFLSGIGLSLSSVAIILIFLEFFFRVAPWDSTLFEPEDLVQGHFKYLYDYDPLLGWTVKPNAKASKWDVQIQSGEDGIRSNGHLFDSRSSNSKILVVGDSFAFGDEVGDSDTWPARLEQLMGRKNLAQPWQVLNAGVSSYGLDQMLLRAEQLVPKYRPKLLIFSFIPDDIQRCAMSVRHGVPKSYFVVGPNGLRLMNVPVRRLESPRRSVFHFFLLRSYFLRFLISRTLLGNYWNAGTMGEFKEAPYVSIDDVTLALLRRLIELKRAYHFSLLIMVEADSIKDVIVEPSIEEITPFLQSVPDKDFAWFNVSVPLHEMSSLDKSKAESFYHSKWAGHMSPEGNQFVAEVLYQPVLKLLGQEIKK